MTCTRKSLFPALALTFIMLFGLLPTTAVAVLDAGDYAEKGEPEEVYWKVYENGDPVENGVDGSALTLGIYGKGRMRAWDEWSEFPWQDYCHRITRLVIESGITNVSENFSNSYTSFGNLPNLKSVKIPDSVQEIGRGAFGRCYQLEEFIVSKDNRYYEAVDGVLFSKGDNPTLLFYPPEKIDTQYSLPDHITAVSSGAFSENPYLVSVIWSRNITCVPADAFFSCLSLQEIDFSNANVTEIEGTAFAFCESLQEITLPSTVTTIDSSAFWGLSNNGRNESGFSIDIPASVTNFESEYSPADVWLGNIGGRIIFRFHGNAPEGIDSLKRFLEMGTDVEIYFPQNAAGWEQANSLGWNENRYDNDGNITFFSYNPSAAPTAHAATQTIMVDNKPVEFHAYALLDENNNYTNYIKLRDIAKILNGSKAQFEVDWDGTISITTDKPYTANGSELIQNFSGNQPYTKNTSPVKVDGIAVNLDAITLTDTNGGGFTYFKLRDLGCTLGFNVSWINGSIVINTNEPYSDAN